LIFVALGLHLRVVAEIEIATGHAEASLIDACDDLTDVVVIGLGTEAEESDICLVFRTLPGTAERAVDGCEDDRNLMFIPHIADAREKRPNGREVVDFGACLGCAGGVEVADLLFSGGAGGAGCFVFLQDPAEDGSVPLLEDAARAPRDLVGRNGVGGEYAGADVLVEIDARADGGVDVRDVDVLQRRQGVCWSLGRLTEAGDRERRYEQRSERDSQRMAP
jgi:hypothetical protein